MARESWSYRQDWRFKFLGDKGLWRLLNSAVRDIGATHEAAYVPTLRARRVAAGDIGPGHVSSEWVVAAWGSIGFTV